MNHKILGKETKQAKYKRKQSERDKKRQHLMDRKKVLSYQKNVKFMERKARIEKLKAETNVE